VCHLPEELPVLPAVEALSDRRVVFSISARREVTWQCVRADGRVINDFHICCGQWPPNCAPCTCSVSRNHATQPHEDVVAEARSHLLERASMVRAPGVRDIGCYPHRKPGGPA